MITMNNHFLLIEDGNDNQWPAILEQALATLGKLSVVSPLEALITVSQNQYDLVIIDSGTDLDVLALLADLRQQQPTAKVVIATASPTWQKAREAIQAGAIDYMTKSLDTKGLQTFVQKIIQPA